MSEIPLSELSGECFTRQGKDHNDVVWFLCPLCKPQHGIMVSWEPPSLFENNCVWQKTGDTTENITISPSINCDVPSTYTDPKTGKVEIGRAHV